MHCYKNKETFKKKKKLNIQKGIDSTKLKLEKKCRVMFS